MKLFSIILIFVLLASLCLLDIADARRSRSKSVQGRNRANQNKVISAPQNANKKETRRRPNANLAKKSRKNKKNKSERKNESAKSKKANNSRKNGKKNGRKNGRKLRKGRRNKN